MMATTFTVKDHFFILDGTAQNLFVLHRRPVSHLSACPAMYPVNENSGVMINVVTTADNLVGLRIDPWDGQPVEGSDLNVEVMALVLNGSQDPDGEFSQGYARIELIKPSLNEDVWSLVVDGIGIVFIEDTDPFTAKYFTFQSDKSLFLKLVSGADFSGANPSWSGTDMMFLQITTLRQ